MRQTRRGLDVRWRHFFHRTLEPVEIKAFTGYEGERWEQVIPALRPWRHFVTDAFISGAAPKNFVHVYDHNSGRRDHPPSWPAYIAKVGHKRYPTESITEQLMTRVGETLGVRMAASRLMVCAGQIRFLSRYFLSREESLVHGADILGSEAYLGDEQFVAAVGQEKLERDVFTFPVFCEAIHARFAGNADAIILDFVRLVGFDAIVGNQDRHFQNWGVIVDPKGLRPPRFSPVYDTARGLFWNEPESQLVRLESDQALLRYIENSQPLIGWEGEPKINHFSLVEHVAALDPRFRRVLSDLCLPGSLTRMGNVIESEFKSLLSKERRHLIRKCLGIRLKLFASAIGAKPC